MQREDDELMRLVIESNDMQAFNQLVLRYRKPAVSFAVRYNGDYYLSEDMVQEAFARIYLRRDRYRFKGQFRAYLFKIIRNICIDHYRKHGKRSEQQLIENMIDNGSTPEELTVQKETFGILNRLLQDLNERYRTALYLREYAEMSYQEIAQTMGISLGQVRMLIYRGRKKLKKLAEQELR